jgi:acetolactate synthase regulatory subunit
MLLRVRMGTSYGFHCCQQNLYEQSERSSYQLNITVANRSGGNLLVQQSSRYVLCCVCHQRVLKANNRCHYSLRVDNLPERGVGGFQSDFLHSERL